MPSLADFANHLELPTSLVIVTRDREGRTALARCGGARVEGARVRVAVALPEGARCLANLTDNGAIALTAALPRNYHTLQTKGIDARLEPWPEMETVATRHWEAFTQEVVDVGIPRAAAQAMMSRRFEAIVFTPTTIFDQTPGSR